METTNRQDEQKSLCTARKKEGVLEKPSYDSGVCTDHCFSSQQSIVLAESQGSSRKEAKTSPMSPASESNATDCSQRTDKRRGPSLSYILNERT